MRGEREGVWGETRGQEEVLQNMSGARWGGRRELGGWREREVEIGRYESEKGR